MALIPSAPRGAAWQAHLDSLCVTEKEWSWQSWASRYWQTHAEGEVPVIKALEVGLSCDETLSWGGGQGGGEVGIPVGFPAGTGEGEGVSQ